MMKHYVSRCRHTPRCTSPAACIRLMECVISPTLRAWLGSEGYTEARAPAAAVSERARRVVVVRRGADNALTMLATDTIGQQMAGALRCVYKAPTLRRESFSHECLWTLRRDGRRWGCVHGFNCDAGERGARLTERGDEA